jgi:hypothetical protein
MCPYWQFRSVDEKKVRRNTWLKVSSLAAVMGTHCWLRMNQKCTNTPILYGHKPIADGYRHSP